MSIHIACSGADVLPLDAIEDFQGKLKKRSARDVEMIIRSIDRFGFSFPFFVWRDAGHNRCLDGHGRIQALAEMRKRGADLPLFPVCYIEAADEAEARQKLLRLNSQYGAMDAESVLAFADGMAVDWDEIRLPSGEIIMTAAEVAAPDLASGDREPFQQMTFTLADEQAETVKAAIAKAKASGAGNGEVNANSNGNALAFICEAFNG